MSALLLCIPFIGVLMSIALGPLIFPKVWHQHYGKIAAGWLIASVLLMVDKYSYSETLHLISHTLFLEYIPFICLVSALYTISGGLKVHLHAPPTPIVNSVFLLIGSFVASFIGTAGASMILIRPFLKLNQHREHRTHQVIFFIFLISNIGGALTPLGDPPLFMGFLKGINFFWTTEHLMPPYLFSLIFLIGFFYIVDKKFYLPPLENTPSGIHIEIENKTHFILLISVIVLVLQSGLWSSEPILILGSTFETQNIIRDFGMILITAVSILLVPMKERKGHEFHWEPLVEVAKLFAAIFVTLIPVVHIAQTIGTTLDPSLLSSSHFFWATGILSAFLDNAPTYLLFFNLAGGNPSVLMTIKHLTLEAISLGAVYMGAITYIGNAPNFMVASIAKNYQIKMPSFFGYMMWSIGILVPLLALINWLFI